MNLTLKRKIYCPDGIFGVLEDETGSTVAVTLEHAFKKEDVHSGSPSINEWYPKLNPGNHKCVKGPHRLHGMTSDFLTFEITGVPGHSNILFHWGNYNDDSNGCVLVGKQVLNQPTKTNKIMITSSVDTFHKFMELQSKINEFILTVEQ